MALTDEADRLGRFLIFRPADARFSTRLMAADEAEELARAVWNEDPSRDVLILQVTGELTRSKE